MSKTALRIPEVEFVLSAPRVDLAPRRPLPEIAFAGRSNVGKSSLINSLLNRKQMAQTSRTPGKTRLLNYYLIGRDLCYFVDLPGYGYARVSNDVQEQWGESIEDYLRRSSRLVRVVLILDIRHGLTPIDRDMVRGLHTLQRPWMAVLTKTDKLGTNALSQALKGLSGELISLGARAVLPYSSSDHTGRDATWKELFDTLSRA
jgi:GTP-binding protein